MSQSGRRGPAIFASSNQHIGLSSIAHRGQWNLESFATLMEYICETSHSDQKVGRALCGWENPQLQVTPPCLKPIMDSTTQEAKVHEFVSILFQSSMHKLVKPSFARALVATLLMYLRDTLQVCPEHNLHCRLKEAANLIFPVDDEGLIMRKLLHWGDRIRSQFIMDNLTQFKASTILDNLSEEALSIKFVGANTFADTLGKLVGGYRGMMNEILELRRVVLDLADATKSLGEVIQQQQTILSRISFQASNESAVASIENSTHVTQPVTTVLRQPRRWPQSLQSLNGLQLSTLIYEYVGQRVDMVPRQPNNRAQGDVQRAIKIAAKFEPDLLRLQTILGERRPANDELKYWREAALATEAKVLSYIAQHKPEKTGHHRARQQTGRVPAIVRTWKAMGLDN